MNGAPHAINLAGGMSIYHVNLTAINPKREELRTNPIRVIVDTGAELSWLPLKFSPASASPRVEKTL